MNQRIITYSIAVQLQAQLCANILSEHYQEVTLADSGWHALANKTTASCSSLQ